MPRHGHDVEAAFSVIYNQSLWGEGGSRSGDGSTMKNTRGVTRILLELIASLSVRKLMDAPCGAMAWQLPLLKQLAQRHPNFSYLGLDVVESVIEGNRALLAPHVQALWHTGLSAEFQKVNLVEERLPRGYDLILSRDALQHNRLEDVWSMLHAYGNTDARWLLVGSYPNGSLNCGTVREATTPNRQIRATGGYFCIDLQQPPFSLNPTQVLAEATHDRKALYLFERREFASQVHRRLGQVCTQLCKHPDRSPPYDPSPLAQAHQRPYERDHLGRLCARCGFSCV